MMDTPVVIRFIMSMITVSFFIVGLLLIKRVLKRHLSISYQYKIGYLLLIMLTVPFLPSQLLGWSGLYESMFGHMITAQKPIDSYLDATIRQDTVTNYSWLQDFSISVSPSSVAWWSQLLIAVWGIGALAMLLLTLLSNAHTIRVSRTARPVRNPELLQLFQQSLERIRINRKIGISTSSFLKTPILIGLFRPYVILPDWICSKLSPQEMSHILMHELIHYKRKDLVINYIMCLFQIVYWFNPLVWLALKEMRIDRELACDCAVLEMLDEEHYVGYGYTLINLVDQTRKSSHLHLVADIGGSKKQIHRRIQQIASYSKTTRLLRIKSGIVFVCIACILYSIAPMASIVALNSDIAKDKLEDKDFQLKDLSSYFHGVEGSFVLYDSKQDQYTIFNEAKSIERVSPDSTYKIYSLLLALETGMISRESSVLEWDGTEYSFSNWNQDQDLNSAMKNSVNWYFQRLDQAAGMKRMEDFFKHIGYGNKDLSAGLPYYWLESSLKISPIEQVEQLRALYMNQLQFDANHIQTVKDALLISQHNEAVLSGKTGSGIIDDEHVNGWFVGYVEADENIYYFATNVQQGAAATGTTAASITLSILNDMNIY